MKKKEIVEKNYKSCPRCAKKNELDAKKCVKCNYDFNKKGKSIWFNVIISAAFVIILIFLRFYKVSVVTKVSNVFKITSIGILVCLIVSTLCYGKTEQVYYPGDEAEIFKKRFLKFRVVSIVALILALILAGIGVFYYLTYVK